MCLIKLHRQILMWRTDASVLSNHSNLLLCLWKWVCIKTLSIMISCHMQQFLCIKNCYVNSFRLTKSMPFQPKFKSSKTKTVVIGLGCLNMTYKYIYLFLLSCMYIGRTSRPLENFFGLKWPITQAPNDHLMKFLRTINLRLYHIKSEIPTCTYIDFTLCPFALSTKMKHIMLLYKNLFLFVIILNQL